MSNQGKEMTKSEADSVREQLKSLISHDQISFVGVGLDAIENSLSSLSLADARELDGLSTWIVTHEHHYGSRVYEVSFPERDSLYLRFEIKARVAGTRADVMRKDDE